MSRIVSVLLISTISVATVLANDEGEHDFSLQYPGLTQEQARCPEQPNDPDFWYLSEFYKDIPRCFSRHPIGEVDSVDNLVTACQKKYERAIPVSVHSKKEVKWLAKKNLGGIIGLYEDASKLANLDNTEVDYDEVDRSAAKKGLNFVLLTKKGTLNLVNLKDVKEKYVLCMTYAYPRELSSYHQPAKPAPNLAQYKCEGEGWHLKAPCGGSPFCYKSIPYTEDNPYSEAHEFNLCGVLEPNSFPASLHCKAELDYVKGFKNPGLTQLGYELRRFSVWNKFDNWINVDGTPLDYLPWGKGEPNNNKGNHENLGVLTAEGRVYESSLAKLRNGTKKHSDSGVLCKKPAVKKIVPLDVPHDETFELNGTKCRKEKPSHWNHRCPSGSDSWRIVESDAGVHCFDLVPLPPNLTKATFNDDLCKAIHPNAKLASFHSDTQVGLVRSLDSFNKTIVGLQWHGMTFKWSDGTPVNKSFIGRDPKLPKDAEVAFYFQDFSFPSPMDADKGSEYNRPLLIPISLKNIEPSAKAVCKIEAEPLLPCTPLPDVNEHASLDNTKCEPGWEKQRLCGNVYCYKNVTIAGSRQYFQAVVEKDYCKSNFKGSNLASIHCVEEHYYVQSYPHHTIIGLHVPRRLQHDRKTRFDIKDWKWTDGSPVDFVGWNRFSKRRSKENKQEPVQPTSPVVGGTPGFLAYNKFDAESSGWTTLARGYKRALCKKKASVDSILAV